MQYKRTILLALTTTHHGFYRGIARYAREHNWHLVPDMLYAATIPYGWQGDGIISHVGYWKELADFIADAPQPCVELTNVRGDLNRPHIKADNRMIGTLAARHFLKRFYWHFAWAPFTNDAVNAERLRGFREPLRENGLECHILPPQHCLAGQSGMMDWHNQQQDMLIQLKDLPKPLAIFCYNDCVAANILHLCQETGIRVPEEVVIMGTDNDVLLCESLNVSLSSVIHDLEGIGYQGAELLDRLMDGEEPPSEAPVVSPTGIVARQSTDMIAVENVEVAKALRYIWDYCRNPLTNVPDVVAATNLSRRPLELAFKQGVGRSIHEEIIRFRLECAKDLLLHTNKTIAAIATEVGFSYAPQLYRVFRRHFGITPKTFRMKMKMKVKFK